MAKLLQCEQNVNLNIQSSKRINSGWSIKQRKKRGNLTLHISQFTLNCLKATYDVFILRAMQQERLKFSHVYVISISGA